MNKKILSRVFGILFIISMSVALFLTWQQTETLKARTIELDSTNQRLREYTSALEDQILNQEAESDSEAFALAKKVNTIRGYFNFLENNPEQEKYLAEIKTSIDKLLNMQGYTQLVETNGNELFEEVNSPLKEEFIRFKTDKSVRNGAIGIENCGSYSNSKIGVVLKGQTVRIEEKCYAKGSKSVWGKIAYRN